MLHNQSTGMCKYLFTSISCENFLFLFISRMSGCVGLVRVQYQNNIEHLPA